MGFAIHRHEPIQRNLLVQLADHLKKPHPFEDAAWEKLIETLVLGFGCFQFLEQFAAFRFQIGDGDFSFIDFREESLLSFVILVRLA